MCKIGYAKRHVEDLRSLKSVSVILQTGMGTCSAVITHDIGMRVLNSVA
jgi:hypothetical protein